MCDDGGLMAFYYLIHWVGKLIVWYGIHWSGVAASGESSDEPSATSQESGYKRMSSFMQPGRSLGKTSISRSEHHTASSGE